MDERFIAFFYKKTDNRSSATIIRSLNLYQRNYFPMYLLSM